MMKSAIDELKVALEKAQKEFTEIEEAILNLGKDKDWDPEVFVPAIMFLYATGSKELGMPFEKAVEFAAKCLASIYEVELVDVRAEDEVAKEEEEEEDKGISNPSRHVH